MRDGWTYKKLREVCAEKKQIKRAAKCFSSSEQIQYIDISSIDNSIRKMTELSTMSMKEAPSRAQQKVEMNDILISTVRPNLKNIAIVDREDNNLVASSGFCVLRTSSVVEQRYVYYFVTSDLFTNHLVKLTTGANYPAVRDQDILESFIPLPPIPQQRLIVSELDEINSLIALKREQLKKYDELAQSLFYEMFGDPVENEKGWEVKKLGEVCECITDGDHMPPPKSEIGIPFVTIGNVNKETRQIEFDKTYFVPREYFDNIPEIKKPKRGDVLYTVTGSYGIPIIINFDKEFCFQRHIGLLRPKSILNSIFLCLWASNDSTNGQADLVATGIAQKTVSLKSLRNFDIILPPLSLQQLFSHRIEQIEEQKKQITAAIAKLETLLASRMQYWFE